jgi:hypothetical protein
MPVDLAYQGPRIRTERTDYLSLWQYFEKRGSDLKGSMLQVITLLIGFSTALLGYCADRTIAGLSIREPWLLLALTLCGIVVAVYSDVVIREFGEHINMNFDRASMARTGNTPLDEILELTAQEARSGRKAGALPGICVTVRRITRSFGIVFAIGAALAVAKIS